MSHIKDVIDFGADPTGKNDSSKAFSDAATSSEVATVIVPPGDYVISRTVDLKRKNMSGAGKFREGQIGKVSCIRPGSKIDGPMFKNQGAVVDKLYFYGGGEKSGKTVFDANGYNSLFKDIHFSGVGKAIHVEEIMVNFSVVDCVFIMVGYGTYCHDAKNGVSTTARFERNEFNNCGNAIVFRKQINGATFQDNIFEFLSGDAVVASHIYDCNFVGNWWEKRRSNGTESMFGAPKSYDDDPGYPPIRSTAYQQIMRCFAAGNKMTWGWRNDFSGDQYDDRMGGVSNHGGKVSVRTGAGRGVVITPNDITQQADHWAGLGPFVIEAASNGTGKPGMTLRANGGPVTFEDKKGEAFTGALTIAKGDGLFERYTLTRNAGKQPTAGLTGVSEMMVGGKKVQLVTGLPQHFLWRQDKLARGLGGFTTNKVEKDGRIRLCTDYLMDNPIIQVTVHDMGVRFEGLEYVDEYINNSKNRRQCKGFVLHFVDGNGKPKTPTEFSVQLLTLDPGIATSG